MAHKWYKEIMAVAEAAETSSEPWTVLQHRYHDDSQWDDCTVMPSFRIDWQYRIKPRTVTCTLTYPEPLRVKPEMEQRYYVAAIEYDCNNIISWKWKDSEMDNLHFNNGRTHLTKAAARAHVEAEYSGSRPK